MIYSFFQIIGFLQKKLHIWNNPHLHSMDINGFHRINSTVKVATLSSGRGGWESGKCEKRIEDKEGEGRTQPLLLINNFPNTSKSERSLSSTQGVSRGPTSTPTADRNEAEGGGVGWVSRVAQTALWLGTLFLLKKCCLFCETNLDKIHWV